MSAADVQIDLRGRIALVTGGTGGMGRVITTELARAGAHVVTTSRDHERGEDLRRRIATDVGADRVEVLTGDLASRTDLLRLAAEFAARHDALHMLVNNAGAHYRHRWLTVDGVESHLAVNHLAGFSLTYLLRDRIRADPPSRVVNVVSAAMSNVRPPLFGRPRPVPLDLSGVADVRELSPAKGFVPFAAYARAKLLATICGYEFADRWRDKGVTVNAVHPGIVSTGIVDDVLPTVLAPFRSLIHRRLLTVRDAINETLDGGDTVGYLVASRVTELALDKARTSGIAVVGAHQTWYTGMFSYYLERVTQAGFVGMAAGSGGQIVAPHGASQARFGTNPIAFGFPSIEQPVIWDIGTAQIMLAEVLLAHRLSQQLPDGMAFDPAGLPTRNPLDVLGGAVTVWGGHRGSGLALVVQLLGMLARASAAPEGLTDCGILLVVIDPGLLADGDDFRGRVTDYAASVRATRPVDPTTPVRMPFDRSAAERARRLAADRLDIPDEVHAALLAVAGGTAEPA